MTKTVSKMMRSAVAVAAMAMAGVSAQAATFAAPVDMSFTLSQAILDILGSTPVITTYGGASASGLTITLPDASTTMSSSAAADLITSAESTAYFDVTVTATSGTKTTLTLSNFVYDNSTKGLSATIKYNGNAVTFSGPALTTTSSTVTEAFNAPTIDGILQTGDMMLTTNAANGLMTTMGLSTFQQSLFRGTLTSTAFGTLAVKAVPEPSTYALMGLGLVGIALTARKRQAV